MFRLPSVSIRNQATIVAIGETPTDRLGSKPGEPRKSSAEYISWAMRLALEDAGLSSERFSRPRPRRHHSHRLSAALLARRSRGDSRHHPWLAARRIHRWRGRGVATRRHGCGDSFGNDRSRYGLRHPRRLFPSTGAAASSPATCAIGKSPTVPWDRTARSPWSCAGTCTNTARLSITSARSPSRDAIMRV